MAAIILIDHYDSFSNNIIDWFFKDNEVVAKIAHDDKKAMARLLQFPAPIVLSPGPNTPGDVPGSVALVKQMLGKCPILGICLGHQILAVAQGARLVRAKQPFHGEMIGLSISDRRGIFAGVKPRPIVRSYNSLVVGSVPRGGNIIARNDHDEIQAIAYDYCGGWPSYGFQFHPESFNSDTDIFRQNWLKVVKSFRRNLESSQVNLHNLSRRLSPKEQIHHPC